jgi:hypothetical protein
MRECAYESVHRRLSRKTVENCEDSLQANTREVGIHATPQLARAMQRDGILKRGMGWPLACCQVVGFPHVLHRDGGEVTVAAASKRSLQWGSMSFGTTLNRSTHFDRFEGSSTGSKSGCQRTTQEGCDRLDAVALLPGVSKRHTAARTSSRCRNVKRGVGWPRMTLQTKLARMPLARDAPTRGSNRRPRRPRSGSIPARTIRPRSSDELRALREFQLVSPRHLNGTATRFH